MTDYGDWLIDDSAEMVAQMRAVLADPHKTVDEKLEALTLLANLADEDALHVLQWYREHADPGLELYAELALAEAEALAAEPFADNWEDEIMDLVLHVADGVHAGLGPDAGHGEYCRALARGLRSEALRVDEGARALVKYSGQAIEITSLDLIVEGTLLVGVWASDDEEQRVEDAEAGDDYEPSDRFYAALRASNLPWGLLLDVAGSLISWDLLQNLDVDRGSPKIEYILTLNANR
ncbi:MAG: GxxExxY protein [Ardenticatenaceae bacterium]|nr:GxxExxY protein [Ardenticatenaceae bacterium]HBY92521.1 hypothetical protein [Chloroflexota bacterium]